MFTNVRSIVIYTQEKNTLERKKFSSTKRCQGKGLGGGREHEQGAGAPFWVVKSQKKLTVHACRASALGIAAKSPSQAKETAWARLKEHCTPCGAFGL